MEISSCRNRLRSGDQAGISTRFCPGLGLGLEFPPPGLLLNSESSQNLSFQDQLQNDFAWSPVSSSLDMPFASNQVRLGKRWKKMNEVSQPAIFTRKMVVGPAPSEPLTWSVN